jgi:probable F420-dependent oxidoreductase
MDLAVEAEPHVSMKVRIGVGLGVRTWLHGPEFGDVVDALEELHFDSLWLSERITGQAPDPIVAMAYAAGRTTRLKFGMSVLVLPGRNPVVLAKELATLAVMSGGRLLPAFGLGVADGREHQAFGVERTERAAWFDEALSVMRACWRGEPVDHHGDRFHYEGLVVKPVPKRLDVWLGGIAPSELRRVGRLADGWLPSFVTPRDAAAGREVIESVAAEHGRAIETDHFGVLIPYLGDDGGTIPDELAAGLHTRRPDLDDPTELVPVGWDALRETIRRFVDVGTTKFVVLPISEPPTVEAWQTHLREVADAVLPLETPAR